MKQPMFNVPTHKEIETLQVGDLALDCFGSMRRVVEISARKEDINGKLFVCYSTEFGPGSSITMSQKEGKLTRTVSLTGKYTSAELDRIEAELTGDNPI